MILLFDIYPREYGNPKRVLVYSLVEFFNLIKRDLKRFNLYTTVYGFNSIINNPYPKPDYGSAILDKVFFDFDGSKAINNIKELHNTLMQKNLKHVMDFSGRGFHCYLFVDYKGNDDCKNDYLELVTEMFAKGLDIDMSCVGDLARLCRIPNTFNFKGLRFCIPVTEEDLSKGLDFILDKAKKQSSDIICYGDKVFDEKLNLKAFRKARLDLEQVDVDLDLPTTLKLIPLVKKILALHKEKWAKESGFYDRYIVIMWLREQGFTKSMVKKFLKDNLTLDEYNHCVLMERQIDYIFQQERLYGNSAYIFPNVETLESKGYILEDLDKEEIKKLYLGKEIVYAKT